MGEDAEIDWYFRDKEEENSMEQLRELEKRVLDVIQNNKELHEGINELRAENVKLKEQCKQFEASLMNQDNCNKTLKSEKTSIKTSIEELLKTIKSLEKNN